MVSMVRQRHFISLLKVSELSAQMSQKYTFDNFGLPENHFPPCRSVDKCQQNHFGASIQMLSLVYLNTGFMYENILSTGIFRQALFRNFRIESEKVPWQSTMNKSLKIGKSANPLSSHLLATTLCQILTSKISDQKTGTNFIRHDRDKFHLSRKRNLIQFSR